MGRFALFEESVGGAELPEAALEKRLRGATGSAITTLRPAGVAFLNGDQYDVVSDGEFIPAGREIYVVHVEGRKIVVRRLPEMMRGE